MEFSLKGFENVLSVTRLANIHYFEFNEQYHTANDRHAFRELVYVDNGSIFVNAENYSGELKKNEIIIHKSLELHSIYCNAPSKTTMDKKLFSSIRPALPLSVKCSVVKYSHSASVFTIPKG